ncbi:hypothetical protein [Blastococcus sp. SYSU DS0552]
MATLGVVVAAVLVGVGAMTDVISLKWSVVALVVNPVCLAGWWRTVTADWVRAAADRYAERLLAGASRLPDAPASSEGAADR